MPDHICRPMQETELDEVADLVQKAGSFAWSRKNIQDSLLSHNDISFVLCAAPGNTVHGYAVIHTVLDEGQLLNIVIKKQEQGRGLGTYFLQQLIEFVKNQNQTSFSLEVRASNAKAIKLYENTGFKRSGIRKAYYPTKKSREDAWLYSLSLV